MAAMEVTDGASTTAVSGGKTHHVTFQTTALGSPTAPVASGARKPPSRSGTRRLTVDERGQYTYKKTPSSTLMASLQLALSHAIGSIAPKPHRDILMTDFEVVDTVEFPSAGSDSTPAHKYKDFTFKTYSPEAMRFFREAFGILPEDFLIAMCDRPLREVSNPGASGSLFYLSADDAFIIKTVQKKEARFLQKLLPGYYLNLTQNKRTLLPKYFGLYCYKSGSVNIRIVVMNNLLPSSVRYHEKFDLKGSTYKRKASENEVLKKSPTFKDLDFSERHEEGIILAPEKYEALVHSVERDCKVLESFGIMDYSLLLGIHNIDQAIREKAEAVQATGSCGDSTDLDAPIPSRIELSKNFSIVSTEDIPSLLAEEQQQRHHYPEGYIQGRIHGDRVMFYLGIIDILQSYRLKKKLEHGIKSIITDGATVSVHNPSFYARRFQDFMTMQVFKKDKTKYRTRKNSTNVQLRGRRPHVPSSIGMPRTPLGSTDRQNSRDSRTSPLIDPPSYNQAMKGTGLTAEPVLRTRSLSESVSSSTSRGVYTPKALAKPAKTDDPPSDSANSPETGKTGPSTSYETAVSQVGGSDVTGAALSPLVQDTADQDVLQRNQSQEQSSSSLPKTNAESTEVNESAKVTKSSVVTEGAKVTEKEEEEGEFARHVRGTSTPIDLSPPATPTDRSHMFDSNYDGSNLEHASMSTPVLTSPTPHSTVDAGGSEDGVMGMVGSVKQVLLQRGVALDDAPHNSLKSAQNGDT